MIRLPRNFPFFKRLPDKFLLKVLKKGNATANGCWYYVDIKGHHLNILSEASLHEGEILEIEKDTSLMLKINRRFYVDSTKDKNIGKGSQLRFLR